MKLRTISCQEGTLTLHEGKKQDFSRPVSETSENVYLFVSFMIGICMYLQRFFDVVRNKLQTINIC